MNSLTQGIEYAIKQAIEEYSSLITSKYENIEPKELEGIWNNVSEGMKITVSLNSTHTPSKAGSLIKAEKVSTKKKSSASKSDAGSDSGETCPYLFTKGKREGEKCGSKPKGGLSYCSRHKKHEGSVPKVKKSLPKSNKVMKSIVNIKLKKPSVKKVRQKVLKKNKAINRLWNVETQMVFHSAKDRTVIGKCVDDAIVTLTDEDIETCKEWCFAYRITNVFDDESNKIARSITEVPKKSVEVLKASSVSSIKKSIAAAISETNLQAKDVESILGEMHNDDEDPNDEGDDYDDEEYKDFEYEDELLDEE